MVQPFIYIAGLRRTGSTVLGEALTILPHSFIFNEPRLGECTFWLHPGTDVLRQYVDLDGFCRKHRIQAGVRRRLRLDMGYMLRAFKADLLQQISPHIPQVGVKEVRHSGWCYYRELFPDMRVILTARDPRDIYLSMHRRRQDGKATWSGPFTPERVASILNTEFEHQLEMSTKHPCFKARYEDLCTNPEIYQDIKKFCGSTIPEIGRVGYFNAIDPRRVAEYELHEGQITDKRIHRWKTEQDPSLQEEAGQMIGLMAGYCEFWGYGPGSSC
jgi:hypothetical protein